MRVGSFREKIVSVVTETRANRKGRTMTQEEMMRFSLQLREARRVAAEIERDERGFASDAEGPPGGTFLLQQEPLLAPAA